MRLHSIIHSPISQECPTEQLTPLFPADLTPCGWILIIPVQPSMTHFPIGFGRTSCLGSTMRCAAALSSSISSANSAAGGCAVSHERLDARNCVRRGTVRIGAASRSPSMTSSDQESKTARMSHRESSADASTASRPRPLGVLERLIVLNSGDTLSRHSWWRGGSSVRLFFTWFMQGAHRTDPMAAAISSACRLGHEFNFTGPPSRDGLSRRRHIVT